MAKIPEAKVLRGTHARQPQVAAANGAIAELRINDETGAELEAETVQDLMPIFLGHIEEKEWDQAIAMSAEILSDMYDIHAFLKTKVQS